MPFSTHGGLMSITGIKIPPKNRKGNEAKAQDGNVDVENSRRVVDVENSRRVVDVENSRRVVKEEMRMSSLKETLEVSHLVYNQYSQKTVKHEHFRIDANKTESLVSHQGAKSSKGFVSSYSRFSQDSQERNIPMSSHLSYVKKGNIPKPITPEKQKIESRSNEESYSPIGKWYTDTSSPKDNIYHKQDDDMPMVDRQEQIFKIQEIHSELATILKENKEKANIKRLQNRKKLSHYEQVCIASSKNKDKEEDDESEEMITLTSNNETHDDLSDSDCEQQTEEALNSSRMVFVQDESDDDDP